MSTDARNEAFNPNARGGISQRGQPVQPARLVVASRPTRRILAFDFVKGALVLVMVLYHWLNYFVEADYYYKYLRFLTPSFIFITGFLITHSLSTKRQTDGRTWRRLMHRGVKILALFVVLNIIRTMLVDRSPVFLSYDSFVGIYITGNSVGGGSQKAASFFILVPIAYLLFITSLMTVAVKYFKNAVHVTCGLFFLLIALMSISGKQSVVLELVSAGLLGTSAGYIPMDRIQAFAHRGAVVVPLLVGYLVALSVWAEVYALQILGVVVMLTVIYLAYGDADKPDRIRQVVVLLGTYPLVGYIGQIAVLQVLRRSMFYLDAGEATPYLALLSATMLTVLIVWVTDRARKVTVIDRLYVAVFG